MEKINKLDLEFLIARKTNDVLAKNLLSTFKGEYENGSKNGITGDELIHTIAKKMIKSAELIGTDIAKREIEILKRYLPEMATIEQIIDFLRDKDLSSGGKLIGLAKSHFNNNVDPKLIQQVIKELI